MGWQSVNVNRYHRPRGGGRSPNQFLKTEKDSGYDGNSPAPQPGERDNPFSRTPSFVSLPVLERIFFSDQISQNSFLQIYIEIWLLLLIMHNSGQCVDFEDAMNGLPRGALIGYRYSKLGLKLMISVYPASVSRVQRCSLLIFHYISHI